MSEQKEESSFVKFARQELEYAGAFNSDAPYGGMVGAAVMALVEVFDQQGHSGMSASLVAEMFRKLTRWEPVTALTGEDDEWNEVRPDLFQNKRCPSVFKDRGGRAYHSDGRVFRDPTGRCYTSGKSRVYIPFPYVPKTEFVDVDAEGQEIPPPLTFDKFARVNMARCWRWHHPDGWSPQMWGLAACGEAGEMANALKKLHRHDTNTQQNAVSANRDELIRQVGLEIGDTVTYLDLLCQRLRIRMEDCVRETFNRISVREDFPERLVGPNITQQGDQAAG